MSRVERKRREREAKKLQIVKGFEAKKSQIEKDFQNIKTSVTARKAVIGTLVGVTVGTGVIGATSVGAVVQNVETQGMNDVTEDTKVAVNENTIANLTGAVKDVVAKEETEKVEVSKEEVNTVETVKPETVVENTIAMEEASVETIVEETVVEEVVLQNVDLEEEVQDVEVSTEDLVEENHDEKACLEGLTLLEGDVTITRNVVATTIHGEDAMTILKGQKVQMGESRGNGKISVLAVNEHGEEIQLVIREDVLDYNQKEHNDDCDTCVPEGNFGVFSHSYAKTTKVASFYKTACNDSDYEEIGAGQLLLVLSEAITDEDQVPASKDGGKTWGYVALTDIEIDRRATQLDYLNNNDAVTVSTVRDIVAKGYGFDSEKTINIPKYTMVKVFLNSSDGSEIAISYNDATWVVSIEDAMNAGILK